MPSSLNVTKLRALVNARMEQEQLTYRDAAARVGVSAPTLSRLANNEYGGDFSLPTFLALCDWLACSPLDFLELVPVTRQPSIAQQLSSLLACDTDLNEHARAHVLKTYELLKHQPYKPKKKKGRKK